MDQKLSVKWNDTSSEYFGVTNGVRQGGILSPLLFSVYIVELLNKLRMNDAMGFRNFTRLTPIDFEELLLMLGGQITKEDTKFRETIPASLRLAITLRFLASGDSYTSLMYTFRISKQAISRIVPEVCEAIISALKQYVKVCIYNEF